MNHGTCKSCRRLVLWATSAASGRPMPLEEDREVGNIIVCADGRAHAFPSHGAAIAGMERLDDADRTGTYLSHHARCPAGESWQGRHRQPDAQGSLL